MKITDLLKKQSICLDGKADSKEQVVKPSSNEKKKELQELVKALQSRMARLKQ